MFKTTALLALGSFFGLTTAAAPLSAWTPQVEPAPEIDQFKTSTSRSQKYPVKVLAAKFVEFINPSTGRPVLTKQQVEQLVSGINEIWLPCDLQLKLEEYQAVDPTTHGLSFHLSQMPELDPIRKSFDDSREVVVIDTGSWNHATMGAANAWTAMPGNQPAGAVIESFVADDVPIVAHELGHYLGLDHLNQNQDLMNPIIYHDSVELQGWQCSSMRQTADTERSGALRLGDDLPRSFEARS